MYERGVEPVQVKEPPAKFGVEIETLARLTPKPQVVAGVAEVLGLKLTAYIVGVKDTRTITSWMKPPSEVALLPLRKLQAAWVAINLLKKRYPDESIATWFTFITDALDDASPAAVLRNSIDETIEDNAARVSGAARRDSAR